LATATNRGQTHEVVQTMGTDLLSIERRLDQQILEINQMDGAYNGHVPISLIFALTGCLVATSTGSRYVVVANESSASIPDTQWKGRNINHQWSKSLEFERLFQGYISQHVNPSLHYTSLIRSLSSFAVAKLFAQYPAYFEVFTSDNSLFKITQSEREHPRWSTDSPKSLSSYILLAPWMSDADLERTFGSNFLDKAELEPLLLALIGEEGGPVLDCVGTVDELLLGLSILQEQGRMSDAALMKVAARRNVTARVAPDALQSALAISSDHAIPESIAPQVLQLLNEKVART